jgi:hypothetical protein
VVSEVDLRPVGLAHTLFSYLRGFTKPVPNEKSQEAFGEGK